jgi:hypothetical protein
MIKLANLLKEVESEQKCPIATQNIDVNVKNRQIAIDRYGYGPLNPNNPNIKFWREKMEMWKLDTMEEAREARCNNCAAFNITSKILNCIEKGLMAGEKYVEPAQAPEKINPEISEDVDVQDVDNENENGAAQDAWDTVEAGKLGYCTMHKFKCAGSRTCNTWVSGGPVKDKK